MKRLLWACMFIGYAHGFDGHQAYPETVLDKVIQECTTADGDIPVPKNILNGITALISSGLMYALLEKHREKLPFQEYPTVLTVAEISTAIGVTYVFFRWMILNSKPEIIAESISMRNRKMLDVIVNYKDRDRLNRIFNLFLSVDYPERRILNELKGLQKNMSSIQDALFIIPKYQSVEYESLKKEIDMNIELINLFKKEFEDRFSNKLFFQPEERVY